MNRECDQPIIVADDNNSVTVTGPEYATEYAACIVDGPVGDSAPMMIGCGMNGPAGTGNRIKHRVELCVGDESPPCLVYATVDIDGSPVVGIYRNYDDDSRTKLISALIAKTIRDEILPW